MMDWPTITWSMVAAACLTLAVVHLLICFRRWCDWAHLVFSCSAISAAVVAGFELALMKAQTPEESAILHRWVHPSLFILAVSLVWFVRLYLQAGRTWLAWSVVATRGLAMVINFIHDPNLNYDRITSLRQVDLFGMPVSIAVGEVSRWALVAQLNSVLLLVFLVDAMLTVWKRGQRQRAITICGSMIVFITVAAGQSALVQRGLVDMPYIISIAYLGIIMAMGYELSSDVVRAAALTQKLDANEHALWDIEQRLDVAAATTGLAIWQWDLVSEKIWLSEPSRKLFEFRGEERTDLSHFLELIHPDDRQLLLHSIANSMNGAGDYQCEFRLAGEPTRWLDSRGRVEFDGSGKPVNMRAACVETTKRKRAEFEAQVQRDELAHLSRVAMLGELSGSLAHELNQPLTAILSNAEAAQQLLLRGDGALDEVREILDDIVADDSRAGEIIQRLRLLHKKGELKPQPLDVNETVREVMKLANSSVVNQNITIRAQLGEKLPEMRADRVQVQQILLNLIMNACDAMAKTEAGERQLTLRTGSANGNGIEISVVDRGCGIPVDKLERVFEPFFSTKTHGLGLGLSVCRTIVGAHGGKLWATNNPDRGASFHLTLPSASSKGTHE